MRACEARSRTIRIKGARLNKKIAVEILPQTAEQKIEGIEEQMNELRAEFERDAAELTDAFAPQSLDLDTETLKPTRANTKVDTIALLWLPYDEDGQRAW